MVWKIIVSIFIQRQSGPAIEQLVHKLSESWPIRRSAQLTAYVLLRGKDKINQLKDVSSLQELNKKAIDFKREIEEEFKKAKDNYKK